MNPELDHIFIICDVDAPEATALTKLGLVEGPSNVHPGQGTACRRFFFPLQYLELLWVRDPDEAQNQLTRPTRLWDRWSTRRQGTCPFGLVFRPGADAVLGLPFPTWSYRPRSLHGGLAIEIAIDTPIAEPEFFLMPFSASRRAPRPAQRAVPGTAITQLCLGTPTRSVLSPASRWAESAGLLSIEWSVEYVLTVTFDHAPNQHTADCRPALPLILHW
jgi:hypothetical protein